MWPSHAPPCNTHKVMCHLTQLLPYSAAQTAGDASPCRQAALEFAVQLQGPLWDHAAPGKVVQPRAEGGLGAACIARCAPPALQAGAQASEGSIAYQLKTCMSQLGVTADWSR